MYQLQQFDPKKDAFFTVPNGEFERVEDATGAMDDLVTLAGARVIDGAGSVVIEHPMFEVHWEHGGESLSVYAVNYRQIAVMLDLPLDEYLSDDENTAVHNADGELIGWMTAP